MIQTFYDKTNNRFICAPLRCGSSYTEKIATSLKWESIDEIFQTITSTKTFNKNEKMIGHNASLKLLYMMHHEEYKNSEWVTFVRNPWVRYLSASSMILGSKYGAPNYVSPDEIKLVEDTEGVWLNGHTRHGESAWNSTDIDIMNSHHNNMFFDFTLRDDHLIPILTVQLLMYALNENVQLIKLENLTDYMQKEYPAGTVLQPDFYDLISDSKRNNSDSVSSDTLSVYKRFLEPLAYYHNDKARRFGIEHTFSDFIQYDIDAWDLIASTDLTRENAKLLLVEMMEEPYFYSRNRKLFQVFMGTPTVLNVESTLFKNTHTVMPLIQQSMYSNSWLNLSNPSSWI